MGANRYVKVLQLMHSLRRRSFLWIDNLFLRLSLSIQWRARIKSGSRIRIEEVWCMISIDESRVSGDGTMNIVDDVIGIERSSEKNLPQQEQRE
jgi:hypothetical protein